MLFPLCHTISHHIWAPCGASVAFRGQAFELAAYKCTLKLLPTCSTAQSFFLCNCYMTSFLSTGGWHLSLNFCVLDVQLFWCFSVISRQYLRSLFLMYALFSWFLNSMWVNWFSYSALVSELFMLYLICLTIVMLYDVHIVRRDLLMTQDTMQIKDILGIITFWIFSKWDGVFKLLWEFLLPYCFLFCFFFPRGYSRGSCYSSSSVWGLCMVVF